MNVKCCLVSIGSKALEEGVFVYAFAHYSSREYVICVLPRDNSIQYCTNGTDDAVLASFGHPSPSIAFGLLIRTSAPSELPVLGFPKQLLNRMLFRLLPA
jgi:hypothetical protein